jgi:nitrite reductase/ring-hydroxylating ferredoxin subunit
MAWTPAIALDRISRDRKAVVKLGARQIALFEANGAIYACNNRCPHEGYPLREGTLDGCVLTCNWHNWKFDLRDGTNLLGGDRLRTYPTRIAEGRVWVDLSDPPAAEREAAALANLRDAFDDHAYDRMARELARLIKIGSDPLRAVAAAILWSHDRLEFGTTHAYPAAAGWLALYARRNEPEARLISLVEAVGHMAWDVLREPVRLFTSEERPFDPAAFLGAVEAEDEVAAVALLRGALAQGLRFADLERVLTAAALRHYADFGHSLIYVVHTGHLIERLGPEVEAPLLLALTRSLVYAYREDRIPEFRRYAAVLADWPPGDWGEADEGDSEAARPKPADFFGRSINEAMRTALEHAAAGAAPEALFRALIGANALNLLRYDTRYQERTDGPVADNVGWLSFTHGITFANAVREQCRKYPEFWPQGLLQMACFAGRNAGYTDPEVALEAWRVEDLAAFDAACLDRIFDHGERDYIFSAHLLKTYLAAREEVEAGLPPEIETVLMAAVNRYFRSPLKHKHTRRTAHQALRFVALED